MAYFLVNLGEMLFRSGRYSEAESHLLRAQALSASETVRGHVDGHLGLIAFATDQLTKARRHLESALASIGPGSRLEWAETRYALARVLWRLGGQRERALELAREARAGYRKLGAAGDHDADDVGIWLVQHGADEDR